MCGVLSWRFFSFIQGLWKYKMAYGYNELATVLSCGCWISLFMQNLSVRTSSGWVSRGKSPQKHGMWKMNVLGVTNNNNFVKTFVISIVSMIIGLATESTQKQTWAEIDPIAIGSPPPPTPQWRSCIASMVGGEDSLNILFFFSG